MAVISSTSLISTLSLFHLTLAYFLLTDPAKIADQNLVFILGEAMGIPHATAFASPSSSAAFLAVVLSLLGVSDLVAVGLPEEIAQYHWGNQAPIRLLFFFVITGYTYFSSLSLRNTDEPPNALTVALCNSMVFTWGFVEMINWFWVFVTLRDERRALAHKLMTKKRAEEEQAIDD